MLLIEKSVLLMEELLKENYDKFEEIYNSKVTKKYNFGYARLMKKNISTRDQEEIGYKKDIIKEMVLKYQVDRIVLNVPFLSGNSNDVREYEIYRKTCIFLFVEFFRKFRKFRGKL